MDNILGSTLSLRTKHCRRKSVSTRRFNAQESGCPAPSVVTNFTEAYSVEPPLRCIGIQEAFVCCHEIDVSKISMLSVR